MKQGAMRNGDAFVITASGRLARTRIEADGERCTTRNCGGRACMTYLDRRICQKCWGAICEERPAETQEPDAAHHVGGQHDDDQAAASGKTKRENNMGRSKKSKANTKAESKAKKEQAPKQVKAVKAAKEPKSKRVSALDAAATVLQKAGQAMRCTEMIAAMAEQGLWTSPGGKTPHATLYSAILREITAKGKDARFTKVERGKFEFKA